MHFIDRHKDLNEFVFMWLMWVVDLNWKSNLLYVGFQFKWMANKLISLWLWRGEDQIPEHYIKDLNALCVMIPKVSF